jgi:hypothetical protein
MTATSKLPRSVLLKSFKSLTNSTTTIIRSGRTATKLKTTTKASTDKWPGKLFYLKLKRTK